MKFSKSGGKIEIGGQILREAKDGIAYEYIEVFVQDTGYGISKVD
jgi:hypothetical protein